MTLVKQIFSKCSAQIIDGKDVQLFQENRFKKTQENCQKNIVRSVFQFVFFFRIDKDMKIKTSGSIDSDMLHLNITVLQTLNLHWIQFFNRVWNEKY